jgi:porin
MVEVEYMAPVAHRLQIRPNIQYVVRPVGAGKSSNPLVLGLFTRITF